MASADARQSPAPQSRRANRRPRTQMACPRALVSRVTKPGRAPRGSGSHATRNPPLRPAFMSLRRPSIFAPMRTRHVVGAGTRRIPRDGREGSVRAPFGVVVSPSPARASQRSRLRTTTSRRLAIIGTTLAAERTRSTATSPATSFSSLNAASAPESVAARRRREHALDLVRLLAGQKIDRANLPWRGLGDGFVGGHPPVIAEVRARRLPQPSVAADSRRLLFTAENWKKEAP